jgi:hypothetical protein
MGGALRAAGVGAMNHLITFGGSAYDGMTARVVQAAPRFGVDNLLVYDDRWLTEQPLFQDPRFQYLYTHKGVGNPNGGRGFGWFAWKPTVIKDALRRASDGDVVMFIDADTLPIADLTPLYNQCRADGGQMAFMATATTGPLRNGDWNKRDCMITMGMDTAEWRDKGTAVARFMLFQKGAPGIAEFLDVWQGYCLNPDCQTFEPSKLAPEHPGFREHRCEQAIYTNLVHRKGLKLYREACEFGKDCPQDWDLYWQLFSQQYTDGVKSLAGSKFRNV